MDRNRTVDVHIEFIRDPDKLYHKILNWNSSFNGSYEGRRHNISHFIEFQASILIWRYVAPVILVVGTLGSILSLLVLCRKSLRSQTTMFYLSTLAIADLMVLYAGLVRLWLEHAENIYIRLMSRAACKAHNFFVYVSLDLSVWILVAVSVDRCLYVTWPQLARKWCKLKNARITVSTIAFFSALINAHFFWTYDLEMADSQHIYANGNKKCYADTSSELAVSFVANVWPWIDFCVYCLFPFMFMATSNSIIIKQLVRTERNMASYSNFKQDGGQRSSTEHRQASQVRMSIFTSPERNSNAVPEEKTNKRDQGNQLMNDTLQLGMPERIIKSSVDPSTVQVVYSSETETQRTLSMEVLLRDGRKSKPPTTDNSSQCSENTVAVSDFDECVTPNVTTIMSGNCQSIIASNKRSTLKREGNIPEIRILESHGVTTDFLKGNPIPDEAEDKSELHVSMINTTSTQGFLPESRLSLESQFDSEKLHMMRSKLESQSIELAVFDKLADAAVGADLTARFQQDHTERKIPLNGIHRNIKEIQPPKSTERRKTLSNKVHPLQQINQTHFPDIFSVSIPDTPGASEEIAAFWTSENDEDDLLIKKMNKDSNAITHMIYDISHAENIINANCATLNSSSNQVLKPNSDHLENHDIGVNKSHYNNEMVGTDIECITHYHNYNTGMDVKKSHCHNDNSGIYVNKSHGTNNVCTDTHNTSNCHNESVDADIQNTSHYSNHNPDMDVNKSHYQNDTTGVARNKSHHPTENIGISVNKSHYHKENIGTDVDSKLVCRTDNIGVATNQSHHHNENNGIEANKSHYHNENIGPDVDSKLVCRTDNIAVATNQSHHHNENNGIEVNKSHYHNENIGTDVNNKLLCRSGNTGVDINQSHYHNDYNGLEVNKSRFHNENIGTDVDKTPPCHGSIRSGTHQGVRQTLGVPEKWQNSSTASDTLTPALLSRRNTSSVSKTLLAVTIVFWILNAPIVIFIIGQTYIITSADDRGRAVVILAWTIVNILQYMNVALHFFLYCLTGPKFRQELKDMFKECLAVLKRIVS